MPKFRKKAVVVEAVQVPKADDFADSLQDHTQVLRAMANWCGGQAQVRQSYSMGLVKSYRIVIPTLEGEMEAWPGDWIIRGVTGEFYPCKPDIFAATYEEEVNVAGNPVAETKQARKDLDAILQRLKASGRDSGERGNAVHYITNAIMWLGMDLKALNEPNPYPESKNPASPRIEPTADGLRL